MKTHLLNLWDAARASYWFVPSLFAAAAVVLAVLMPALDDGVHRWQAPLPEWVRITTSAARATLSALAGAMVTVTGTVFSITVVTLSLTSQQFGPRLLRRFMYDLPTQLTLGVFLATGFYCLLLLRGVENTADGPAAPHLSVLAALALAVLSMLMLIVFIHHIAVLIQAPRVVAAVAADLNDAIARLFPEKIGEPAPDGQQEQTAAAEEQEARLGEDFLLVPSTHEGYVQAIDGEGLLHAAAARDLVVRLRARPGDFLAAGSPLAEVWSLNGEGENLGERPQAEDLVEPFNDAVIVGVRRTPRQDVECAVDELVEVAVRSLSPGINDPFTAINCIDRLGAALGRLAQRKLPESRRCDADGRLRVIARPVSFRNVLDAAFNQIRQYGQDSVAVIIRLLEALAAVAQHVQRADDREAVQQHAEMTARLGDRLLEEHDRQEIRERLARVAASIGGSWKETANGR